MKTIAICLTNEVLEKNKLFEKDAYVLGSSERALFNIDLKKEFESEGYQVSTSDLVDYLDADMLIFFDMPDNSLLTCTCIKDYIKYFIRHVFRIKYREDYLYKAYKKGLKEKMILIVHEAEAICPKSYMPKFHKYFHKIFTWNSEKFADDNNIVNFFLPMVNSQAVANVDFKEKSFLTLIASNKNSIYKNELYSERKKVINYFENTNDDFSFYGYGWSDDVYKNYKGKIQNKIKTLSQYKYCICFENMCNVNNYITEKLFDCFEAQCVPIYWGAKNIKELVPEKTYIDYRDFNSIEELLIYLQNIDEEEYYKYLENMRSFLSSDEYREKFYYKSYINIIVENCIDRSK